MYSNTAPEHEHSLANLIENDASPMHQAVCTDDSFCIARENMMTKDAYQALRQSIDVVSPDSCASLADKLYLLPVTSQAGSLVLRLSMTQGTRTKHCARALT